jgi:hypothetical protein
MFRRGTRCRCLAAARVTDKFLENLHAHSAWNLCCRYSSVSVGYRRADGGLGDRPRNRQTGGEMSGLGLSKSSQEAGATHRDFWTTAQRLRSWLVLGNNEHDERLLWMGNGLGLRRVRGNLPSGCRGRRCYRRLCNAPPKSMRGGGS